MFINYLKARFGPTGEVDTYNETIAVSYMCIQYMAVLCVCVCVCVCVFILAASCL